MREIPAQLWAAAERDRLRRVPEAWVGWDGPKAAGLGRGPVGLDVRPWHGSLRPTLVSHCLPTCYVPAKRTSRGVGRNRDASAARSARSGLPTTRVRLPPERPGMRRHHGAGLSDAKARAPTAE